MRHVADPTYSEALGRLSRWADQRQPLDRWQLEQERLRAEKIGDQATLAVIAEKIARENYGRAA